MNNVDIIHLKKVGRGTLPTVYGWNGTHPTMGGCNPPLPTFSETFKNKILIVNLFLGPHHSNPENNTHKGNNCT